MHSRYDNTIKTLENTLKKEKRRVKELKHLNAKEIESKTELERIIRKIVEDLKEEMLQQRADMRVPVSKNKKIEEEQSKEFREKLIERLLNNERILTLVYDRTFYPELKNINASGEVSEKENLSGYEEKDLQDL